MKKYLFLLLFAIVGYGQTSTGQEQEFDYGVKNNSVQTVTNPTHLTTTGTDGTQGKVLASNFKDILEYPSAVNLPVTGTAGKIYITTDDNKQYRWDGTVYLLLSSGTNISGKEDVSNKQNSLAIDGTGLKYPTVDAVNSQNTAFQSALNLKANQSSTYTKSEVDSRISNLNEAYHVDFIDSGTHTFTVPSDVIIQNIYLNNIPVYGTDWTQNGTLVSVTTSQTADKVTLTGGSFVSTDLTHYAYKDIENTSFPLNPAYSSSTIAGINLISSELFSKGKITEIKINAVSSGIMKFAFFRKTSTSPLNYKVIKYFNLYANSGLNTIQVDETINENFYFGIIDSQTQFYTAAEDVGDPIDLHYQVGAFDDFTTWNVTTGRGTNIEIKINETVSIAKYTGKSICLIGDSITDFCDSPSSNGQQYMGYDYFIQQKLKFKNVFNEGYSGIQLAQSGGFANTKLSSLPVADEYIIFLGTNDFALGSPTTLGVFSDFSANTGVNSFYGAMRVLIDGIYAKNPYAKIILFTPTHRSYAGFDSFSTVNAKGNTLNDFAESIKEVGKYMGLPIVDLFADSGINNFSISNTTYDNLHPNTRGYQYIGDTFINKMYNNY